MIFRDACVAADDLNDAYARAHVLSTQQAVRDRGVGPRQLSGSREFFHQYYAQIVTYECIYP